MPALRCRADTRDFKDHAINTRDPIINIRAKVALNANCHRAVSHFPRLLIQFDIKRVMRLELCFHTLTDMCIYMDIDAGRERETIGMYRAHAPVHNSFRLR